MPGHDGCFYRDDGQGVICSTTPRQKKYERDRQVTSFAAAWRMAQQITLERDPHYSLLTPEIRVLSDGSQMWTYREGGDCA